jgi:hypothetical protein
MYQQNEENHSCYAGLGFCNDTIDKVQRENIYNTKVPITL